MSQDVISVQPIAPTPPEPSALPPISVAEQMMLEQKQRNGANWFLLIAALSLVNSVLVLANSSIVFAVGLGITHLIDVLALLMIEEIQPDSPFIFQLIIFVVDLAIIGSFAIFGLLARQRQVWAFIVGMVLYALDIFMALVLEMWISVIFHGFALFGLWGGMQATRTLNRLGKENRLTSQEAMVAAGINPNQSIKQAQSDALQKRIKGFWIPFIGICVAVVVFFIIVGQVLGWMQAQ